MRRRAGSVVAGLWAALLLGGGAYLWPFWVIDLREAGASSPQARSAHSMAGSDVVYAARYVQLAKEHAPLLAAHGAARFVVLAEPRDALEQPFAVHAEPERGLLVLVAPGFRGLGPAYGRVSAQRAGVRVLAFLGEYVGDLDWEPEALESFAPGADLAKALEGDVLARMRWRSVLVPWRAVSAEQVLAETAASGELIPTPSDFADFWPASEEAYRSWDSAEARAALRNAQPPGSPWESVDPQRQGR